MLPYEVVVRREAHGSYLKRNPHFSKGQLFPQLIVEFFLKTKDKSWKGTPLVSDDPLMLYAQEVSQIRLFHPAKPLHGQEPFLVLPQMEVFGRDDEWKFFIDMTRVARQRFSRREVGSSKAATRRSEGRVWLRLQGRPVAFGRDRQRLPWRVIESGSYIDKQAIATAARSTTSPRGLGRSSK